MTSDELHVATTIAKAEAVIELLWAHLYDTEMSYHNENGAQGYMGGMVQTVLTQLDVLLDDLVEREPVLDEPHDEAVEKAAAAVNAVRNEVGDTIAGVDFSNAMEAFRKFTDAVRKDKDDENH